MTPEHTGAMPAPTTGDVSPLHFGLTGPRRLLMVLVWTIPALLGATQSYILDAAEGNPVPYVQRLVLYVAVWYVWVAATPCVFWLVRRAPLRRGTILRHLTPYLALCGGVLVVQAGVWTAVTHLVVPGPRTLSTSALFARSLLGWLPMMFMVYWAVVITGQWLEAARRESRRALEATQLAAELARAQLQALRMQLHPHFLFNALNTIAVLVREQDTEMAVGLIAELGDVLRHVLRTAAVQEVCLADELAFTRRYLAIEAVRFADRLRVEWQCEREALDAAVPNLVLQPLVENALRHGIARLPGGGRLTVGAAHRGERLHLWVCDDGPGFGAALAADSDGETPPALDTEGIGLSNTRSRLHRLYGDAATLSVGDTTDGACARIELPWRLAPAADRSPAGADLPPATIDTRRESEASR